MWIWKWLEIAYIWVFGYGVFLPVSFFVGLGLTLIAGILSCRLNSGGVFFGINVVLYGGLLLVFAWKNVSFATSTPFFCLLSVMGGIAYLLSFTCMRLRARASRRKAEREKQARALLFTLPDRENSFVRARLNGVLQSDAEKDLGETDGGEIKLHFAYILKLLTKLKTAPLSPAERLEMEEFSSFFGAYRQKESLTIEDVRLLNEAFSRVLKLSAKYGV